MDYEKDLKIDDSMLEVEWLGQAELFMRWAEYKADCDATVRKLKEGLETLRAEIASHIRQNPTELPGGKVTVDAVKEHIQMDEQYIDALTELEEATHDADIAKSAVMAFQMRKDALENLVKLIGQQYFAGPTAPHDAKFIKEAREKKDEQTKTAAREKARGRMKRTKK